MRVLHNAEGATKLHIYPLLLYHLIEFSLLMYSL